MPKKEKKTALLPQNLIGTTIMLDDENYGKETEELNKKLRKA